MTPRELTSLALWMADAPPDTRTHVGPVLARQIAYQLPTHATYGVVMTTAELASLALLALRCYTTEIPALPGVKYA